MLEDANKYQGEIDILLSEEDKKKHQLIVWNDNVNTFDWVIKCLMEICGHSSEQAEQSALFIHCKGKYAVKEATLEELRPMCEALLDRGLSATIDSE